MFRLLERFMKIRQLSGRTEMPMADTLAISKRKTGGRDRGISMVQVIAVCAATSLAALTISPVANAQEITSSSIVKYLGATTAALSNLPVTTGNAGLIALDHQGNLIVADTGSGILSRLPLSGGGASTIASGIAGISAVTADLQGNIYFASTSSNQVVEIKAGGTAQIVVASGLNTPSSLAIDLNGNVIIADTGNNRVVEVLQGGAVNVLTTNVQAPTSLYMDPLGNLYIGGTGLLAVRLANEQVYPVGQNWIQPKAILQAGGHDLYVIESSGNQLIKYISATSQQQVLLTPADNILTASITGDNDGDIYLFNQKNSQVSKLDPSIRFGQLPVGVKSAPYTLTFEFETADALASILDLTQGTADGQLTTGNSSCVVGFAYQAGDTCTVQASVTLTKSGKWNGDVTLVDASGNNLLDTEVFAQGIAPVQALLPGQAQTYFRDPYSYEAELLPTSLAVDAADNLYIGDDGNQRVLRVTPDGSMTIPLVGNSPLNQGLKNPLALALDGKGNLFIADQSFAWGVSPNLASPGTYNAASFTAIPYAQWGPQQQYVNYMTGLLVQPSGGFVFSDSANNRVIAVGPDGAGTEILNASVPIGNEQEAVNYPLSLAYEPDGSLLLVDFGNDRIVRRTSAGVVSDVVAPGANVAGAALSQPMGLAVDPAGNIYIADAGNNRIVGVSPNGNSWIVADATTPVDGSTSVPVNNPQTLALDTHGNLYVGDLGNERIVKIIRTTQNVMFNQTNTGSQSAPVQVEVQNIGNSTLTIQSLNISASTAFSLLSTSTCPGQTTLAPTTSCAVQVQYAPASAGDILGQLNIVSNTQAVAGSTTILPLIGSTQSTVDHFRLVSLPQDVTAGTAFAYVLRAENAAGALVTGYRGTVQISWSENANGPGQYSFTAADGGSHTLAGTTIDLAGIATVTIADTSNTALAVSGQTFVGPSLPASLSILGGGTQSAPLQNAFPEALTVQVLDSFGNLVPGAAVLFGAPASGASAVDSNGNSIISTQTDSTGLAVIYLTANGTPGTYAVTAALQSGAAVVFTLTNQNFGFTMVATPATTTFDLSGNASTVLTITPVAGFDGKIAFTCVGAAGTSCNFSNTALQIHANVAQPGTGATIPISVTINSTDTTAALSAGERSAGALLTVCALVGLFGLGNIKRYRSALGVLAICFISLAGTLFMGCSGSGLGSTSKVTTPASAIKVEVVAETALPGTNATFQRSLIITINPWTQAGGATSTSQAAPAAGTCLTATSRAAISCPATGQL